MKKNTSNLDKDILTLRKTLDKIFPQLRLLLVEAIRRDIRAISGTDKLDLQEFHSEEGIDDPTCVIVEVDRHTGDMGNETIDCLSIDNDEHVYVETENGFTSSQYMLVEELSALYDELRYILQQKDSPEWEFTIKDSEIVLKDEEED